MSDLKPTFQEIIGLSVKEIAELLEICKKLRNFKLIPKTLI